jgi:predicted RNA-binding protein with PUA-like domain
MTTWLFKEEPDHYSYDDLVRDGSTYWNGVTNNLARQNLRKVRQGDRILYYHTGKEKAIVGEMRALGDAEPDPDSNDPKAVVVKVQPVRKWQSPVPLRRIKQDPQLADWDLVRLPRLSVMAVTDVQLQRVERMSRKES